MWLCFGKALKHKLKCKHRSRLGGAAPWGGGKGLKEDKQLGFSGRAQFSGPRPMACSKQQHPESWRLTQNPFLSPLSEFFHIWLIHLQWIQSLFVDHREQTELFYHRQRGTFPATLGVRLCRNAAAVKADRPAFLKGSQTPQNSSWETLCLLVKVFYWFR